MQVNSEIFVLANQSPQRIFVRWYRSREAAESLFEPAIMSGNETEEAFLFSLKVPDVTNIEDVRHRAEEAVKAGQIDPLRAYEPTKS